MSIFKYPVKPENPGLFNHLKTLHHVKTAGIINLILWSALLSAYLLFDKFTGKIDSDLAMVFTYLFVSIIILNAAVFFLLKSLLGFFRYGAMISYITANLVVTAVFFINNMAVTVYGKQLGYEGLVMAWRGWRGGEMGDFTSSLIKMLLFMTFYVAIFTLLYCGIDRLLSRRRAHTGLFGISVSVVALAMFILHFKLAAIAGIDWKINLMKHKIPWQSITGFPEDQIMVDENGRKAGAFPALFQNPYLLDENTELEQLKYLDSMKERILTSNITAKNPMNVLFINVEGLRHDMLNPENMPFLYKFASERGYILKKHYSTGNNTPGGLYGMLTGLVSFYFEPLRGNKFCNMTLEVMKKAGYKQTFYYNSPRNYEWIYRDIIEHTDDALVQIPGAIENYGPRENLLIDAYINDLKKDTRGRRFDYYLMNVTHFNYYYPPECRKYTPDFRANFTIISGPQQGFMKDRIELKNRYMNSVYYADALLKKLITEMEAMGRLKNTIIIIAGDHGEEFWEHGSFGHTWGLNDIQIQPAALIYYPGITRDTVKYKYSSHQDFFPTVFDLIGINTDWERFTTGKSLLRYNPDLDYAITGLGILNFMKRNGYAIMGDGYKILFKNNMNLNESPYAIYDENDNPVEQIDTYRAVNLLMKLSNSKRLKQ